MIFEILKATLLILATVITALLLVQHGKKASFVAKIIAVLCLLIGLAGVSLFFQGLVLFVDAVAHVYPDATGLGIIGGPILMALGIVLSCAFIGVVSLLDFKLKYFIMVVIIVALFSSLVAVRRLIFWEKSQTGAAYHQQPEKIRGIPWNKSR